jgi:predicted GIY-YIG superfamily endonuclease
MHFVYILRTSANTLYIGQTNNLERRLKEHKAHNGKTAKYIRYFKSYELVCAETFRSRIEAMRRELQLKKWSRAKKEALLSGNLKLSKQLKKIADALGVSLVYPPLEGLPALGGMI